MSRVIMAKLLLPSIFKMLELYTKHINVIRHKIANTEIVISMPVKPLVEE